ncbi:uncharacterized protein LOC119068699 [Bradysia coprophila]|uniref:uncharacterized protein LOC119068699 n=1 Tax=Bradysia coprophila TaxID=38358 RepID=UPI00187DBAE0|nr:uncharacterized protein LOC119068699 [Bradysia coprophila]
MNVLVGLLASFVVVQAAPHIGHYSYPAATTLVRVPEHDSAIVHSNRFGSNFAYSIAQRHAYQVVPPNTVALYNPHPFGYSHHHQFNQFPFGTAVPGHPFYIQHPFGVPSFVSVVYPNEQPTDYPDVEQVVPNADSEPTENPDAESVVVDNADIDATREQSTQENTDKLNGDDDGSDDDSVSVEAYRFGGDNN